MNSKFHFDQITRIYDQRRIDNRHEMERRTAEIYSAIPEFKNLDTSISDIAASQISRIVSGDKDAISNTQKQLRIVENSKKELLLKYGYKSDYLDPLYTCSDCKDTGYIGNHRCHCFKKEFLNILYKNSNLNNIVKFENFDCFNIDYYPDDYVSTANDLTPRDNIKRVLNTCRHFTNNFSTEKDSMLLYGPSGVGKTFLSNCIAKEILDKGYSVIYLTSYQLFDILETKVFHPDELDDLSSGILSMINTCDLLIIDDLGTEMINKFTEVQLFICIQERIRNRLSTIISTNLSFDDISKNYSERIFSRLTGYYKLVKITGDDIRIKKALKNK